MGVALADWTPCLCCLSKFGFLFPSVCVVRVGKNSWQETRQREIIWDHTCYVGNKRVGKVGGPAGRGAGAAAGVRVFGPH